ncbi:10780_t:CDS:2 [Ambispora gerdemannii]|uniref:10780_t:CDS:1 n=1 Tax=Ambispora gerdemannii TaxID=144530 RepID=A0A9N9BJV6_9GLOM|nr:10780_t:CDS:2 [Ambispora gerdemannii]
MTELFSMAGLIDPWDGLVVSVKEEFVIPLDCDGIPGVADAANSDITVGGCNVTVVSPFVQISSALQQVPSPQSIAQGALAIKIEFLVNFSSTTLRLRRNNSSFLQSRSAVAKIKLLK